MSEESGNKHRQDKHRRRPDQENYGRPPSWQRRCDLLDDDSWDIEVRDHGNHLEEKYKDSKGNKPPIFERFGDRPSYLATLYRQAADALEAKGNEKAARRFRELAQVQIAQEYSPEDEEKLTKRLELMAYRLRKQGRVREAIALEEALDSTTLDGVFGQATTRSHTMKEAMHRQDILSAGLREPFQPVGKAKEVVDNHPTFDKERYKQLLSSVIALLKDFLPQIGIKLHPVLQQEAIKAGFNLSEYLTDSNWESAFLSLLRRLWVNNRNYRGLLADPLQKEGFIIATALFAEVSNKLALGSAFHIVSNIKGESLDQTKRRYKPLTDKLQRDHQGFLVGIDN